MLDLEKVIPEKIPVRQLRVAELIKTIIAETLVQGKIDTRVLADNFVTVSKVKVSPDLHNATIFVTVFQEENKDQVLKELNNLVPRFRSIIGKNIKTKTCPQIIFRYDDTVEYAAKINTLLNSVKED
jgi:ribosome-binding factor A